ncbi:MAG: CvpA family protein, partial [Alphaproteobacteria bacterium]|nr:CvpA family protein [Alphaproteobacteria bacterium]
GIDRSLGFGFGMIRAIIILACMDLVMGIFFPRSNPPEFLKDTKTLSLVHALGDELMSRLPKKWHDMVKAYQKKDMEDEEKIVQMPKDLSKLQEMNVAALANLIPQSEDTPPEDVTLDTPANSQQIDKLLDDGSSTTAPTAQETD